MNRDKLFRRSARQIVFRNEDLDFIFQWLGLGYGVCGGLSCGEAFAAASRVDERDLSTWIGAFRGLGDRLRGSAEAHARGGRLRSAGEDNLKAFNAYRTAAQMMRPADPAFRGLISDFESAFRAALRQLDIPAERVAVPYAGKTLPGYFFRTGDPGGRGRTLIGIGGGDTYCEDLYFFYGAGGAARGYNLLLVDLPGQGTTPCDGLHLCAEYEKPIRAAVDFAAARREVDPDRLAIAGVSGGGYMVLRGAAFDKRIRAVIADTPMIDVGRVLKAELPPALLRAPAGFTGWLLRLSGAFNAAADANLGKYLWQAGLDDLSAGMELSRRSTVDPRLIECPILCLAGEGESPELRRQTQECYERVRSARKAIRVFTAEEGADSHCQVNNLPLLHRTIYDWLDGIFPEQRDGAAP